MRTFEDALLNLRRKVRGLDTDTWMDVQQLLDELQMFYDRASSDSTRMTDVKGDKESW